LEITGKVARVELKTENSADIEKELGSMGLAPRTWAETSEIIKAKLPKPDWETFSRLHRNFTGYRSETTLERFYGFVFTHGLHLDVNAYRFRRLTAILTDLLPLLTPDLSILDVGAGSGIIASLIQKRSSPRTLVVQDACRAVRDELTAQGFTVLPHPPPPVGPASFDLLLCIDSLGEINADDDGMLAKPDAVEASELPLLLEERYGFAQKLDAWKGYLAPGGRILLWEPFAYQNAMESLAVLLGNEGWDARFHAPAPGRNYLELLPK
jgi:SAM-dependent methyltransferase